MVEVEGMQESGHGCPGDEGIRLVALRPTTVDKVLAKAGPGLEELTFKEDVTVHTGEVLRTSDEMHV